MSEMDWRHYDPFVGRFNAVDKLAETAYRASAYAFANNNPIRFSDPSGLKAVYNWNTGQYNDGDRVVSFDEAMESNGVQFYSLDTSSAGFVYNSISNAYGQISSAAGGGGNEFDGASMFIRRSNGSSEILTRYLFDHTLPEYALEQFYAANFDVNTIKWFSHGALRTIAGGMLAVEFSEYLMKNSELFKSAVEKNTPLTLKLFACWVGDVHGLAEQLSIIHPNLTIWAPNNEIVWRPGNTYVGTSKGGPSGHFNIWINGEIIKTGNFTKQ